MDITDTNFSCSYYEGFGKSLLKKYYLLCINTFLYKNFNIKINPGDWISFVGKTGCGKTTFIKLLLKLYQPQDGVILWNEENLQKLNTSSVRDAIAYVPQDVTLFSGTILENITMFNAEIGEKGFSLSGGEKQKIAICRALLKSPQIIIMDEATSNLDTTSEKELTNTEGVFFNMLNTDY